MTTYSDPLRGGRGNEGLEFSHALPIAVEWRRRREHPRLRVMNLETNRLRALTHPMRPLDDILRPKPMPPSIRPALLEVFLFGFRTVLFPLKGLHQKRGLSDCAHLIPIFRFVLGNTAINIFLEVANPSSGSKTAPRLRLSKKIRTEILSRKADLSNKYRLRIYPRKQKRPRDQRLVNSFESLRFTIDIQSIRDL